MKKSRQILSAAIVFFWMSQYCATSFFTPYLGSLNFTSEVIGFIVGIYGFTQMCLRIPFGIYTDKKNAYKRMIVFGCVMSALSSVLMLISENMYVIGFCRFLAGVASSTWASFTVLYAAYFDSDKSVKAMSNASAFNNAGKLIAILCGTVTCQLWGYKAPYLANCIAGALGIFCALQLKKIPIEKKPISTKQLLSTFKNLGVVVPSCFGIISQFVLHGTAFSFTSTIAAQKGATATELGISTALVTVTHVLTPKLVSDRIVPRFGQNGAVTLGYLLLACYPLLVVFAPGIWMIFLAQAICGLGCMLTYSVLMSKVIQFVPPENKSTAMGIFMALYGIGMTLGPIMIGGLAVNNDYTIPYVTAAGICLVTSFLSMYTLKRVDRYMSEKKA